MAINASAKQIFLTMVMTSGNDEEGQLNTS